MKLIVSYFSKLLLALSLSFVFNPGIAQITPSDDYVSKSDTLRLLLIGNSFSMNATRYLSQLAKDGGHLITIDYAEIGGCSLKKHWELSKIAERNPNDPKGSPYDGKSLRMLLSQKKWDIISIQQYSWLSSDIDTYRPYARNLYNFIKLFQPNAKVVVHQTWAYRSDTKNFSQIEENQFAKSEKEMWQKSREAYHTAAAELDARIVPVGDAFWKVSSSRKAYKKDKRFNYTKPIYPALPNQANSLHVGYYWDDKKNLIFDSHHASDAGCYLASLVWYKFLYGESPVLLDFTPKNISKHFAKFLKKTAESTSM